MIRHYVNFSFAILLANTKIDDGNSEGYQIGRKPKYVCVLHRGCLELFYDRFTFV